MPGEWGSPENELPLVVDTSAWSRGRLPPVREEWNRALLADRFRVSPVVRFEILLTAQGGDAFERLSESLSALRAAPLTTTVIRAAESAMLTLAHRSAGAQRIPVVDYLVAAAAQDIGAGVLHYDRDYDVLAEVMGFESLWLATPGSLA